MIAGGITEPKQLLLRIPAKFQYTFCLPQCGIFSGFNWCFVVGAVGSTLQGLRALAGWWGHWSFY